MHINAHGKLVLSLSPDLLSFTLTCSSVFLPPPYGTSYTNLLPQVGDVQYLCLGEFQDCSYLDSVKGALYRRPDLLDAVVRLCCRALLSCFVIHASCVVILYCTLHEAPPLPR